MLECVLPGLEEGVDLGVQFAEEYKDYSSPALAHAGKWRCGASCACASEIHASPSRDQNYKTPSFVGVHTTCNSIMPMSSTMGFWLSCR